MKKFFILTVFVTLFFGCETELPMDQLIFQDRLVVNLLANDDDILKVHVGKTLKLTDTTAEEKIEDAIVKVRDQFGNTSILDYTFLFDGKYVTSFKPIAGKTYSLTVEHPVYPTANSTFTIPSKFGSVKPTWEDNTGIDTSGFPTGTISFAINDPGDERNYYEIGLYRYETFGNEFIVMPVIPENPEIAANASFNESGNLILDDGSFNGQLKELKFTTPFGYASGTPFKFLVEIKSLSPEYYRYFKSLEQYRVQGGPFSDPVAVFSNINGGVGICAGASITKDTIQ